MPEPPEVPDVPAQRDPDLQPATQGELRSVRRWLLVTAVWAVAATAVALIALLSQDDTAEKESRNVSQRVTKLERDLDRRLESIEEDISSVATREDVTKLAQRLSRVEDDSAKAARDAKDTNSQIDDLETRIEELEAAPNGTGGTQDEASPNENP
jgi:septal ring factor EnvC (AmiA/AmiB activator)